MLSGRFGVTRFFVHRRRRNYIPFRQRVIPSYSSLLSASNPIPTLQQQQHVGVSVAGFYYSCA